MNPKNIFLKLFFALGRVIPGLTLLCLPRAVQANPLGLTVQSGSATISVNGSQFTINAGNNAQLNWQSFNIATGEKTIFNQPSAASIVWNRVSDPNPSQIFGSLQANGVVVLLNSSGFYFGPNSFVGAAGLVVSTANCLPPQNAGGAWEFNGPPPLASIINYGTIKVGNGGSAFLIADKVENHGDISAPGGTIGLAAGQTVTLSERPDGRGMSMAVKLPQGSVDNHGNLIADAGTVALNARVVNQAGLIQANSVQNQNGVIELVAADDLNLGANSKLFARGDDSATGSAGGKITLKSENIFSDAGGSEIVTAGGTHGGKGGDIEVSAPNLTSLNSAMDARAQNGFTGGEFLLDPVNIILGTSGGGTVPANGTVAYNSSPGTLNLNVGVGGAFANKNFSNIKLQATGDITVSDNTVWDLSASTGMGSGQLSLQAGGNIFMNNGAHILGANNWAVALAAGYNFINNLITPGTGSVLLNDNSSIQTALGGISLAAGKDITVKSGYVITTAGGAIDAHAFTGNIDTGSSAQGYHFVLNASSLATAYDLSGGLGGISTMAGGNVNLTAGGNVSSVLPGKKGFFYNGNFVTAPNSDYTTAGAGGVMLVGDSSFNQLILFPSPQGGLVINTTGGGSLAGKLPTSAGAPQIFNLIVSDSGARQYKSSASFGLNDHANTPVHQNNPTSKLAVQLDISGDMNLLSLVAPVAAQINVVGNLNNCRFQGMNLLGSDVTSITVGLAAKLKMELAGLLNPATDGGLTVGGDINNRSAFTSVDLSGVTGAAAPFLSYLSRSVSGTPTGVTLANSFYYNPRTKILTYQNIPGTNLKSILQLLQNLTVQKVDGLGNPLWLDVDQTIPATQVVRVMNATTAATLLAKYNSLGAIPGGNLGYAIGGGGKFEITARNLDLGTTPGIQSKGVGFYRTTSGFPLASRFNHGAGIDINLTGDLVMYSSSIASLNGGDIAINAGGRVSVGSSDFSVTASGARGIYSASLGDVSVVSHGDINVNGSRIAAYDGGNVTVESLNGNINAGTGGFGYVTLTAYYVNPVTHRVYTDNPTIPGSGILATTFPPRDSSYPAPAARVGNILVETPNGSVNASAGGIVQFPLNNVQNPNATVEVLAGYELRDAQGQPVNAARISAGKEVFVSANHNIDTTGSGVIAKNATIKATGDVRGLVFAVNANVTATKNIDVTILASGKANVEAGGKVSGTIIGVGGVSASGSSIDASLLSQNVSASGDTSSAKEGFAQGTAANAASAGASNEGTTKVAKTSDTAEVEDRKKKKPVSIALAQKVSRVTVILPPAETKSPKL